ncbi:MAG: hypothetical protein M3R52_05310, partial [Acidobacteriota bacterium]|nr:hypothetical protein [Acidobacteriota bacterium]
CMNKQRTKNAIWTREATAAVLSFGGGILAALLGCLLTASTWIFGAQAHPWLRGSGTALLIITIPLLIFSGYCLDWMERDRNNSASGRSAEGGKGRILN